jgi:DNA repair protein RecO
VTQENRELCFVLRATPYKDRDLIVALFSEQKGRFGGIARNGVQSRRFGGSLDLFAASDFEIDPRTSIRINEITDEGLVQILSAQIRHSVSLSKFYEKVSAASVLNELILRSIPAHKPAPEVFKLYANCLMAIDEGTAEMAISIVNAFILKLTQWLGVQPSLTRCIACEKPLNEVTGDAVFPQVNKGAWICHDCIPQRTPNPLPKRLLMDAYQAMLNPVRKIKFEATPAEHQMLLEFLEQHLMYFVPGLDRAPLTTTRYLKATDFKF